MVRGAERGRGPRGRPMGAPVRKCLGPTAGSEATVETIWPEMPQQGLHPRGLPRNHGPMMGERKCQPPDVVHRLPRPDSRTCRAARWTWAQEVWVGVSHLPPTLVWGAYVSGTSVSLSVKQGWQCPAVEQRPLLKILWPECSAVPRTEPWETQVKTSTASTLHTTGSPGGGGVGPASQEHSPEYTDGSPAAGRSAPGG